MGDLYGHLITGQTRGSLTSPGYPGRYPHNADCSWTILVEPGKTVLVLGTFCNSTNPPPTPVSSWDIVLVTKEPAQL